MSTHVTTPILIAGGGPAGIAILLAASRIGQLPQLLDAGVTLVEQGGTIGSGMLGRYVINSDSAAETFVDAITANPVPELARLTHHPLVEMIRSHGRQPLPLRIVADFLDVVGQVLTEIIAAHPASRLLTGWRLETLRQQADGHWLADLAATRGAHRQQVVAGKVVLALGACQPQARLYTENVASRPLLPRYEGRIVQSDALLAPEGVHTLRAMLAGCENPRITIIGGASSALSSANVILRDMGEQIAPGHLTLLHQSRLKLFYRTAEEAQADGYADFSANDICPVSQFVHRFGGLRYDSRNLAMRLLGIAGAPPEPRLHALRMTPDNTARIQDLLDHSDAIIACLGYSPRRVRVQATNGQPIALAADQPQGALTGAHCGILDQAGHEIRACSALAWPRASGHRGPWGGSQLPWAGQQPVVMAERHWGKDTGAYPATCGPRPFLARASTPV
ncbi:aminotransferase DegT [Komagataeibacter nataicola]|uniref:aminotransferase DegT n=1 Tax=Komagataeibacter nataicola TaxID=265960 RepID=UPI0028AAA49A|nr:aminotransferase DegT [Komagataeibacter nataicola]WNM08832.1 aminotransferase DegT [Komagataeibacter nataicola]